jgi:hypothetical protein
MTEFGIGATDGQIKHRWERDANFTMEARRWELGLRAYNEMRKQPFGLPIFGAAAALLVGRISIKDILSP